jgi:hypothetical protein
MLLLALQFAGNTYAWNSSQIIGLLCGSCACLILFIVWQWHQGDKASIPPSIFCDRTIFCGAIASFLAMGGPQIVAYLLPIWFQVVLGVSPAQSGVNYLATVIANVVFSIAGGVLGMSFLHALISKLTTYSWRVGLLQPLFPYRARLVCNWDRTSVNLDA